MTRRYVLLVGDIPTAIDDAVRRAVAELLDSSPEGGHAVTTVRTGWGADILASVGQELDLIVLADEAQAGPDDMNRWFRTLAGALAGRQNKPSVMFVSQNELDDLKLILEARGIRVTEGQVLDALRARWEQREAALSG